MNAYFNANELLDKELSSLPKTVKGILSKAKRENWQSRPRSGKGGGKEYAVDSLPAEVQAEIKLKSEQSVVASVAKSPQLLKSTRETAIALRQVEKLNDKQRSQADARLALVAYVHELQTQGFNRKAAIAEVSRQSQEQELPESLQRMAELAVAKKRKATGFGQRALHGWVLDAELCSTPTERLARLSPEKSGRRDLDIKNLPWMPDFMAIYRNKNGMSVAEAHRQLVRQWGAQHGDMQECPTLDQVQWALKKLPRHIREIGRKTGSEMRALQTYVKRDWSSMMVNDCWVGDGHSMKMKVQHPEHGQPFTPELTLIMDAPTRYIVGWSLAYSESTIAVADALRNAMQHHGIPAMYYSDNGGGQKNKTLDADITGILPRLGIHHETGIPGNPQGRGIIERVNKTLALYIARQFDTYYGTGADEASTHKTQRAVKSYAKALSKGTDYEQMTSLAKYGKGKLPRWSDLLATIEAGVEWYNNEHVHREIGTTPAQMREYLLSQADDNDIVAITDAEARDLFRPEFTRKVQRGWLSHHNNNYWHKELINHDGEEVRIAVDIHCADTVIVRTMAGDFICDAIWDGNKKAAFAKTVVDKAREDRAKAAMKRIEEKQAQIAAELQPAAIEHQDNDMIVLPKNTAVEVKKYDFLNVDEA
ncbi:MAG: DDE-type integrase/transposase/recombinase [Gammaproteobacteria bacterium]|nr:DDE-type integrase/transposase/recombinase [Gammaproteobacteria bacterium]